MTLSVYQHWDPLEVCVVGRSYPPEFYSWITIPHVRSLFEKIAVETEEDYQKIISLLESFGVKVLRPQIDIDIVFDEKKRSGKFRPPPMTPRDFMVMVGEKFFESISFDFQKFYLDVKDPSWPTCTSIEDFKNLPHFIQDECVNLHGYNFYQRPEYSGYTDIFCYIKNQGNEIQSNIGPTDLINGAMISRVGKDLYFGTASARTDQLYLRGLIDRVFPATRNHIVATNGHSDGTYCPVAPGLIISLYDIPTYVDTFPDWEVVYLPNQSWNKVKPFLQLKQKNKGRWWIPGFEHDQAVIDVVESWLSNWTGYVEETVFDVNMLIIDPKNVIVFNHNDIVFDALHRYGITPHIVTFRHRYFWDGGIHCITTDLHRRGSMQDFFPRRN